MDWHAEDASWSDRDFRTFRFEQRRTVVLRKINPHPTIVMKNEFRDKQEWDDWFHGPRRTPSKESELHIVLCSRASPIFVEKDAPVSYLSVTRDTWERLTRAFHVHREIKRVIARKVDFFTSHYEEERAGQWKIYFIARMSARLPRDLALSLTYVPSTNTTFAVIYGCNDDQMDGIEERVREAGDKTKYPLLLVGLLVELERKRLLAEVEQLVDDFTLRSDYIDDANKIAADISNEKAQEYVQLCFKSRSLMHHIKAVKRQLSKLLAEIDKFPGEAITTHCFNKHGNLMKKRVQDIINEYDATIDECKMIVEDTTLATQIAYNQIAKLDSDANKSMAFTNTLIAQRAKQEGTQMRYIALLTMIYLPFSSVVAISSMDMFDWNPQPGGSIVSKNTWVFAALTIGLTVATFLAWYHMTSRYNETSETDVTWKQGKLARALRYIKI